MANNADRDLTTVNVRPDTWTDLNRLKAPGDTMDDVISELLESHHEEAEERGAEA